MVRRDRQRHGSHPRRRHYPARGAEMKAAKPIAGSKCVIEPAEIVRLYEIEHWTLRRIGEAAGVSGGRVRQIRDQYLRERKAAESSYARQAAAERIMLA